MCQPRESRQGSSVAGELGAFMARKAKPTDLARTPTWAHRAFRRAPVGIGLPRGTPARVRRWPNQLGCTPCGRDCGRLGLPRPRRLEGHPPVQLAIGPPWKLSCTTKVKIPLSGIADRPAAVVPLERVNSLTLVGLLGHENLMKTAARSLAAKLRRAGFGDAADIGRLACIAIWARVRRNNALAAREGAVGLGFGEQRCHAGHIGCDHPQRQHPFTQFEWRQEPAVDTRRARFGRGIDAARQAGTLAHPGASA